MPIAKNNGRFALLLHFPEKLNQGSALRPMTSCQLFFHRHSLGIVPSFHFYRLLQSLDAGLKISFCRQQIFLLLESDSVKSFLSLDEEFEVFFSSVAAAYYRNLPARPDLVLKVVNDPLRCFPTRYGTGWGVADTNGLKACFGVGFAGVGSISWTTAIELVDGLCFL